MPITLIVGRKYRTFSRTELVCIADSRDHSSGESRQPMVCIETVSGDVLSYSIDGCFFPDGRFSRMDIVEELDAE